MHKFKEVKHVKVEENITVDELLKRMKDAGVMGGGKLGDAATIYHNMIQDKDCKVFLGVAGALIPGGMREVLIDMLEHGEIDVFVCTGAMLTHDLVEALGYHHYKGHHMMDDAELEKIGYDRMYDSLMPNNVYGNLEKFFADNIEKFEKKMNLREFTTLLGSLVSERSLLKACYDKNIPIFCPGLADSGIGLMLWGQMVKGKKIDVPCFEDLKEILDIAWTTKKAGVFYLGGGMPKNYIQQAMQFAPSKAQYGIQITMDRPEPGGSSGAALREGISWGKLNEEASYVDVICDITIALPMLWAAVKTRLKKAS